jgi:serine/threonine protein kinase
MPLRDGDPSRVGRFRLTARLGAGGMGVVYLGTAKDVGQVAVKVLRSELGDDADFRTRFRREISMLTRVQGLCTVRIIEADTEAASPYLVTEYADGPSLAEYLTAQGSLEPDLLYGLATGLAEALTAIHAAGVIHRDLKPANVLLTQSGPKVIDFGIAQALDSTAVTRTGMVVGTPGFMAPEQITGQAGQAADIFAWGLMVAYAATGQPPFGTGPADAILYRILHDAPDLSAVSEPLRALVEGALAKDPAERPSAAALLARLAPLDGHSGDAVSTPTQSVLLRSWQLPAHMVPTATGPLGTVAPKRSGRYLLVVVAAAAVAAVGGGGAALLANGATTSSGTSTAGSQSVGQSTAAETTSQAAKSSPPPSPTSTSTIPAVTQPGASPFGATAITDHASAMDYVAGFGYGSPGSHMPNWDMSAPLNAVVAFYNSGYASGPGKVFFFADGRYVGSDTTDGSSSVGASRLSPTEIVVQYLLYNPGDPQCCASGGTDDVRFIWTGTKLVALDPIPPVSKRT